MLTVTFGTAVSLAALSFKYHNFVVADMFNHFRADFCTGNCFFADLYVRAIGQGQNVHIDAGTFFSVQKFNFDPVVFGDSVLFSARANDCKHNVFLNS